MKKTLITLILLAISVSLFGKQYYYFNKYSTSDGLPSNTITCIVQDKDGFMWIGTRDGMCRFDGKNFTTEGNINGHEAMSGRICSIDVDDEGIIWFSATSGTGSYNPYTDQVMTIDIGETYLSFADHDNNDNIWFSTGDIIRYNKKSGELTKYPKEKYFNANEIAVDQYGSVWITSTDGYLYRYDQLNDSFTEEINNRNFERVKSISNGRLLLSSYDGNAIILDPSNGQSHQIFNSKKDWDGSNILCMIERVDGEIWIGTETGLIVYLESSDTFHADIVESTTDSHAISASYVTCLGKDNEGNIWTGTFYKGLNLWQNKNNAYTIYYPNPSEVSIHGQIVRSIISPTHDVLWIATEDGFLNEFITKDRTVINHVISDKNLNYQDIQYYDNNIWASLYGEGVKVYNPRTKKVIKEYTFPGTKCNRQLITSKGELLLGTQNGLLKYIKETDSFRLIEGTLGSFVHAVANDSKGNIWIGTYGNGLFLFDKDLNLKAHILKDGNSKNLCSNFITYMHEDSRGRMWICTESGICMTDNWSTPSEMTFTSLSTDDGLPSNITCAIAEDKDGYLWISTIKGLTQMNPDTYSFSNSYFKGSQITGNQYSYGATYTAPNGTIYMGTTDGMISVNPAVLKANLTTKKIFIDEISSVSSEKVTPLSEPGYSARTSRTIKIKYKDLTTLRIHYSVPNYSSVLEPMFKYTLKRGSKETSERTSENSASFTNLTPGHYDFTVSIIGGTTAESTRTISIEVIPPFWLSNVALVIYLLTFLGIIAGIIWFIDKQRKRNHARKLTELVHQTQKEVYDAKINFFTNLTHEIRTPLTLIKMPLDKIIKAKEYAPESEKDMLTIQANTARLLTLTNELLDIQKMEKEEQKLSFTRQDFAKNLRNIVKNYGSVLEDRNIKLNLSIGEEPIDMMYAKDSIDKIINNLLSNAVKYGNDIINIVLRKDNDNIILSVESNGEKINALEREKIFEKFYSGGKGTGLGLALSRKIAEMHKGKLYLDSTKSNTNTFVLELPLEHPEQVEFKKIVAEPEASKEEIREDFDSARHSVLVVDDDPDFRDYLSRDLSDRYNTYTAKNGVDALEVLQREKIDLVVSDIMMPEMDGCELCNSIKGTTEYSHVPVILLTAAVGMETRMETLEVGADGYIEKPFPIELLKANIANLFKNREISYHQFANSPLTHYNSITASRVDEEFMDKLHAAIMKHMAEQDLSIETLTNIMSTSKSTLYRKVKANTGLNINEYIRLCRLKQAAEMLSSQKYKVNEVGYLVGFSSPSYFATCFQKQFNISPSAFVKKIKE